MIPENLTPAAKPDYIHLDGQPPAMLHIVLGILGWVSIIAAIACGIYGLFRVAPDQREILLLRGHTEWTAWGVWLALSFSGLSSGCVLLAFSRISYAALLYIERNRAAT